MKDPTPTSHERHPHLFGVACVLFTLLGWSSVPLFLKHFSHDIDAWTSNGWRYGFSALVWAPLLIVHHFRRTLPPGLWRAALLPALFNTLGQICFTHGFYYISPGLFTFGLRTQIVFVAVGAVLLFPNERKVIASPMFIVGAVMVMLGAAGVILQGKDVFAGATAFGVFLAIASGFLFAAYALAVRKFMTGMPSMLAFSAISQYTAAVMLVTMLALGDRHGATAWALPADQFAWLLFSALIGIAIGHVAYYMAIARLGVAVSSGVIQLQPFLVATGSLFLFDERLTPGQWAAGFVAVAGAGLILYRQGMKTAPPAPPAPPDPPAPHSVGHESPSTLPQQARAASSDRL